MCKVKSRVQTIQLDSFDILRFENDAAKDSLLSFSIQKSSAQMERYERLRALGEGTYGTVTCCKHRVSGTLVAIKKFKDCDTDDESRRTATREVLALKVCS